jgi:hypothetical protein
LSNLFPPEIRRAEEEGLINHINDSNNLMFNFHFIAINDLFIREIIFTDAVILPSIDETNFFINTNYTTDDHDIILI